MLLHYPKQSVHARNPLEYENFSFFFFELPAHFKIKHVETFSCHGLLLSLLRKHPNQAETNVQIEPFYLRACEPWTMLTRNPKKGQKAIRPTYLIFTVGVHQFKVSRKALEITAVRTLNKSQTKQNLNDGYHQLPNPVPLAVCSLIAIVTQTGITWRMFKTRISVGGIKLPEKSWKLLIQPPRW